MGVVSLAYTHRLLELIAEKGVSQKACLKAVGMTDLPWDAPKYRIPCHVVDDILCFAAKELKNPVLGLELSRSFRISRYGKLGSILAVCDDLEHAAYINARYAHLVHSIGTPTPLIKGPRGNHKIQWLPSYPPDQYARRRQIAEYVMTNYVTSIDWLAWSFGKGVETLRLAHPPGAETKFYEEQLDCEIEFDSQEYAVVIKKGLAKEPIPTANPAQFGVLKARQERILASFLNHDNLVFKVEQVIRETIEFEKPRTETTAKALKLSPRSMRRYLAEQKTSFKDIFDNVKKDLAQIKLSEGQSIKAVAQSLWYSDQAAFTRAYKKWFGVPPGRHKPR